MPTGEKKATPLWGCILGRTAGGELAILLCSQAEFGRHPCCFGQPGVVHCLVIASTACGFGTYAGWNLVAEGVVWVKLRTLVEGAVLASARL
jgi:hypothetical protein